jgi:iron complex outermembrane receptor protein
MSFWALQHIVVYVGSLLALVIVPHQVKAQHHYQGHVLGQAGKPLVGATVVTVQKSVTVTDSIGYCRFQYPDSSVLVTISHAGYQSLSAKVRSNQPFTIYLSATAYLLGEVVVNAYESNSSLAKVAASVAVLPAAQLQRYTQASFVPAFNTIPGVKMDERSPGSYRLSIRGNLLRSPFGIRNVKVYWNGIPFTDAGGNTYLNQVSPAGISQVEVIKGPGGSMYGAGTGGVLLLSSNSTPKFGKIISMNSLAGSYGTAEGSLSYQNSNATASQQLVLSRQQADGWRQHTQMQRSAAQYAAQLKIDQHQQLSLLAFYSHHFYQTPGGLTQRQMDSAARQARPATAVLGSAVGQQASILLKTVWLGVSHQYSINSRWSNTSSVYISHTRFRNPSILNYQRKTEVGLGGRNVLQYKHQMLTLHVGGEFQYGYISSRVFGNKQGQPDTLQFDDEIGATQYHLFAQAMLQLPAQVQLTAGVSYNSYGYQFTRLSQLPVQSVSHFFNPVWMPRLSLQKQWKKAFTLYASLAGGYSPPGTDEVIPSDAVFNSSLQAEKAINMEIGSRISLSQKLFIQASAYALQLQNTIVSRRNIAGAEYFVNAGSTRQRGLELSANYYWVQRGNGFLSQCHSFSHLTWQHARFGEYQQSSNNANGKHLTGIPSTVWVAGTDAQFKNGMFVNLTYNYTGRLPLNDANSFTAEAYSLVFAKLGFQKNWHSKWELRVQAAYDGALRQPYSLGNDLNAAGNRFFNPAAPHNWSVGMQVQLHL